MMKNYSLVTLCLLPFLAGCNFNHEENPSEEKHQNVTTRNYRDIKAEDIHPAVDDGYRKISGVLIDSQSYISEEDSITYLYKLSCKDNGVSFQVHRFECASDGCFYAELSETQHGYIPNGFDILKNSNKAGSAVEIVIDKIYNCYTYTEVFYSQIEHMVKVINYDHVIPELDETTVNSLVGLAVDKSVYVDERGITSGTRGTFPFSTELKIEYIDVSDSEIQIDD